VEDGIQHLRSYQEIIIHPRCKRWQEEARLYRYKIDPRTDDVLPQLVDANNHCLVASTPIITERGVMPIGQLVGTTGRVWTMEGWRPYHHARQTSARAAVYRITMDDGQTIDSTAWHPFLTPDGYVPAFALAAQSRIIKVDTTRYAESTWDRSTLSSTASDTADTTRPDTTSTAQRMGRRPICTETCGSIALGQSQKGSIFTMWTTTRLQRTTESWPAYQQASITPCTLPCCRTTTGRGWLTDSVETRTLPLENGTAAQRGGHGTASTPARFCKDGDTSLRVTDAGKAPCESALSSRAGFAQTLASRGGEGSTVVMTFQGNALAAVSHSPRTVTPSAGIAPSGVPWRTGTVVKIEPIGYAPVYNLEVPGVHHFALDGGIITHNCMDATRYALAPLIKAGARPFVV
jgi:hypothetical protein